MRKRIVLAYSGGLDTSVAVHWMREQWDADVIAVAVDVGQGVDPASTRERALAAGAIDAVVVDARSAYASEVLVPSVHANATYEGRYPLLSALSRPVIVAYLVAEARRYGAAAVAHGCTGKGNDQVRFEVGLRTLAPDLEVLSPVRSWGMTREDAVKYADHHHIPVSASSQQIYSIDENIWGRAIECGAMEDPWASPPDDAFTLTRVVAGQPASVVLEFDGGVPVALDGRRLDLVDLIGELNTVMGSRGFGRVDMVESRRVGIKSREVYECPGALAILMAHRDLEGLTLERDLLHEKLKLESRWAELVYDGLWYSPLRKSLDAFFASAEAPVSGEVRLEVSPGGGCVVGGRRSQYGLYDYGLATYDAADRFRHEDAAGFVRLFGLGLETWGAKQGGIARGAPSALEEIAHGAGRLPGGTAAGDESPVRAAGDESPVRAAGDEASGAPSGISSGEGS